MLERASNGLGLLAGDGQRHVATVDRHVTGTDGGRTRGSENVLKRLVHLWRRKEMEEWEMVEEEVKKGRGGDKSSEEETRAVKRSKEQ